MKTKLVIFWFLCFTTSIYCQDTKSVLIEGISTNYAKPKTMRIEIDFSESSDVCGPGKQFNTVYDQFYSFLEKLNELGDFNLNFEETLNISNLSNQSNKVTFACIIQDSLNLGSKLSYAGKYAFSDDIRYIDVFDDKNFEEEDIYAINALDDAKRKAELLMESFGYTKYDIIYIDDDTSPRRKNGAKSMSKKREFKVYRHFFEEKEVSRYKLFVGFKFYN